MAVTSSAEKKNWAELMEDEEEDEGEMNDKVVDTNLSNNESNYSHQGGKGTHKKTIIEEISERAPGRVTIYLNKAHVDAIEDDIYKLDKLNTLDKVHLFKRGSFTLEFKSREDAVDFLKQNLSKKLLGKAVIFKLPKRKSDEDSKNYSSHGRDSSGPIDKQKYETKPRQKQTKSNRKESYDWDGDYDYDSKNQHSSQGNYQGGYGNYYDDGYYDEEYDDQYDYKGSQSYHGGHGSHSKSYGRGGGWNKGSSNRRGNRGGGGGGGGYKGNNSSSSHYSNGSKPAVEYVEKKSSSNGGSSYTPTKDNNPVIAKQSSTSAAEDSGNKPYSNNFYRHEARGPLPGEENNNSTGNRDTGPRKPIGFYNKARAENTHDNSQGKSKNEENNQKAEEPKKQRGSNSGVTPVRKGSTKTTNRFETLEEH